MMAGRTAFAAILVCCDPGPHVLVRLLSLLRLNSSYLQEELKMFYFAPHTRGMFKNTSYLLHLVILRIRKASRRKVTIDRTRI